MAQRYVSKHGPELERAIARALEDTVQAAAPNPVKFFGATMLGRDPATVGASVADALQAAESEIKLASHSRMSRGSSQDSVASKSCAEEATHLAHSL